MKTKTYQVYKFEELSEKAQEKALDRLRETALDYDWWDFTYEDAKNIGIEITGFDLYRCSIEGKLLESVGEICRRIVSEHGKQCLTYKQAVRYYQGSYRTGDEETDKDNFLRDILREYRKLLQSEYEYQLSDEAIKESIEANDYEFTEDGKLD